MHKVKELWNRAIFLEKVDPESVLENRLSPSEIEDGCLNLSNLEIPKRCFFEDTLIKVVLINTRGEQDGQVTFRCRERQAQGKKGITFKRQRFWPVNFSLKDWYAGQKIGTGDLIMIAVSERNEYLIFRAFRPKTVLIFHDRRDAERRWVERRLDDRRTTLVRMANERRTKERRRNDRRNLDRRRGASAG